jgi:hypothetical protein
MPNLFYEPNALVDCSVVFAHDVIEWLGCRSKHSGERDKDRLGKKRRKEKTGIDMKRQKRDGTGEELYKRKGRRRKSIEGREEALDGT